MAVVSPCWLVTMMSGKNREGKKKACAYINASRTELVLALYIHVMRLLILSLYENRNTAQRAVPGHDFSGVITAIGKDVQDFEIGDRFADGATAEFCITLPQNIGPVRAMELK